MAMSEPQSVAQLLSHPGCVAESREWMLQRFEELVLYDGEPVFLKPEVPDKPAAAASTADRIPAPVTPARQFQTLPDVADWIARNWPDFDLEAKPPVTKIRTVETFQ